MLKMLFNFQKLVTHYCRWRHSDVLIKQHFLLFINYY